MATEKFEARGIKPTNFALQVRLAYDRIQNIARKTPIDKSLTLSKETGINLLLKHEHLQHTGSFKIRGASNKILKYLSKYKSTGFITASTGNHGMATSYVGSKLGIKVTVFTPKNVDSSKKEGIINYGSEIVMYGDNCIDAELEAIKQSKLKCIPFMSAYNDWDIIMGQGSIAVEIMEQIKQQRLSNNGHIDAIFVSVGGGGLIGGIAVYIKSVLPNCKIYGVQPLNSPVMYESVKAGKVRDDVKEYDTLSDGTAGLLEPNLVNFELCRDYVDEWVIVNEKEIAEGMYKLLKMEHMFVEGSAAMALAAAYKVKDELKGKTAVVVLCGRNMSADRYLETIKELKQQHSRL